MKISYGKIDFGELSGKIKQTARKVLFASRRRPERMKTFYGVFFSGRPAEEISSAARSVRPVTSARSIR